MDPTDLDPTDLDPTDLDPTDLELLRAYACDRDAAAFAQIVRRHADWLFNAARRRVRDDQLADDVVQAVFVILTQKAARIASKQRSLSAWLFHVLYFACARAIRSRSRQAKNELRASATKRVGQTEITHTDALLNLLEDAIAQLPARDRQAIVRRFYKGESLAAVGESIRATPEAARKRISRALATIRHWMIREGIDAIPEDLIDGIKFDPLAVEGNCSRADVVTLSIYLPKERLT